MAWLLVVIFSNLPIFTSLNNDSNHAIYISVCEIDHRSLGNSAGVNVKVFETDIRDAFQNMFSEQPNFSASRLSEKYGANALKYFSKYLKIKIDGKEVPLKFKSLELNGDSVWFYFDFQCNEDWESVEITADYLMELFPDQSNVVSVYHGDDKKFLRITRSNKSQEASFLN